MNTDRAYLEDGPTGFQNVGARIFDPSTGRFLTSDPAFFGRNWFAYCDSNPTGFVDPSGKARVELHYNSVGPTCGYHAFIVVTETEGKNKGHQWYCRGGIDHLVGWDEIAYENNDWKPGA